MTYFRVLMIVATFVMISNFGSAQQSEDRKRFKHEFHGAIPFASGDDYELKCDIYQPIADHPRPVMLAIHGGAWTTGTKLSMYRHARILANRGYLVMAIDYRLAPVHKWPAQIHDCKHAVRWIRENATKYNADPERVYAFGYSAGAHLAALLATTGAEDGLEGIVTTPFSKHSSKIHGAIAGGAPTEFSWIGQEATTLKYWLGATKSENPEVYAAASPTTYITADDPPMVFFHGIQDNLVPLTSPEAFIARCEEAGADAALLSMNGGHIATFTWTTNFLNSLSRLEEMLSETRCRRKISKLAKLTRDYVKTHCLLPQSLEELGRHAVKTSPLTEQDFHDLAFNERDDQMLLICWNREAGVVVTEAKGVNGKKLSNLD